MTIQKKKRILAIDPGTRYLGIVVLDDTQPVYYAVKTLGKSQKENIIREVKVLITRLIRDFKPDILAIEQNHFNKESNFVFLNDLSNIIAGIGKMKGIETIQISPATIRKHLCGNGHAGKDEVVKNLVSRFPEFKVYMTQDRKWKTKYHRHMFDALAVAVVVGETK